MLHRLFQGARPLARLLPLILVLLALTAAGARAETRIALVVGNGGYSIGPLPNAVSDARLVSGALRDAGFQVTTKLDADQRDFKRAVRDFADQLKSAGEGAVAAFYYAGHGVQIGGRNFLVPVNTPLRSAADVEYETIDAQWVLDMIGQSGAPLSIIMLDACRNNPFPSVSRAVSQGLARMDAPRGAILSYSTAPGAVALDGKSGNSPYTAALARAIRTPGLKIEEAFKQVRRAVLAETNERQVPWESSSLLGDFYFSGGAGTQLASVVPSQGAAPAPASPTRAPTGDRFRDCPDCPPMVRVRGGAFQLGSPRSEAGREGHEGPQASVSLRDFALMETEVTVADYSRFLDETGRSPGQGCWVWAVVWLWDGARNTLSPGFAQGPDHPASCISFPEAQAFAAWMSRKSGRPYRLPSEAELEWAMGGDAAAPWGPAPAAGACGWGNQHDQAAYAEWGNAIYGHMPCNDGFAATAPVRAFRENSLGLRGLHGNLWEWTADCWRDGHVGAATDGAARMDGDCTRRVVKGGHFLQPPQWSRPAWRYGAQAKAGAVYGGLRLARDL
ncbi:SUMF1/EgtB/PvdO family nonheme iron enzyme [Rhodovulum sp. DZ06]|uniref:SUMF1/EgtB/PvdO family nonheme iron enzyme n=1 Tax=Rhodovulum sp. DZ06 TaxID=3425126 RepID=UPI003D34D65C